MASPVLAKSQHLHDFSLPLLKWTKNPANSHQQGGKPSESSPQRSPPDSNPRQSPVPESAAWRQSPVPAELEHGHVFENPGNPALGSTENAILVSSSDHLVEKVERKESELKADGYRSKIYIRLRTKNKPADVEQEGTKDKLVNKGEGTKDELVNEGEGTKKKLGDVEQGGTKSTLGNGGEQTKNTRVEAEQEGGNGNWGGECEETVAKRWNFRPRKPIQKSLRVNGGPTKPGGEFMEDNKVKLLQLTPNRPEAEAKGKEKKRKFSIALSRQEIEEDILKMTGSKPARRPKKRAKTIQKNLDYCFPGLWLASITPNSYKVSEAHRKG